MEEEIILVDTFDNPIGYLGKTETHKLGLLHRAFSVFIFNDNNQLLLQQRAKNKYHSGGLWTNSCCSHPRKNETTLAAAERRLMEEMGISTPLKKNFDFIYKATVDNELTEHEYDHVFFGNYNSSPIINTDEVMDWKYESLDNIKMRIQKKPNDYTEWFKICFDEVQNRLFHSTY
jgi:isopentenyl-diphosphate delta-isomerase